jgi:hypothetical protein
MSLVDPRQESADLSLGVSLPEKREEPVHGQIVHPGGLPHERLLATVLAHPQPVDDAGRVDQLAGGLQLHEPQEKARRPVLVHAESLPLVEVARKDLGAFLRIVEPDLLDTEIFRNREQLIDEEPMASRPGEVERQHPLTGQDPFAGQVEDGGRIRDDHLGNVLVRQPLEHPGESFWMHGHTSRFASAPDRYSRRSRESRRIAW